jgi:hypothetical protein
MTNKQKIEELILTTIKKVANPHWIVGTGEHNSGELGFRACGLNFWYYKWPDPSPSVDGKESPWRIMEKCEFGHVIKHKYMK